MDIQTPDSRTTDPVTSHIAEDKITATGKRQAQQREILTYIKSNPGCTSGEIAAWLGGEYDNVKVSRRLSDLKGIKIMQGDKKKCPVNGTQMCTWWPLGSKCLGQWQADITNAGDDITIKRIINEAPQQFRQDLINHAVTIRNIRKSNEMKKKRER